MIIATQGYGLSSFMTIKYLEIMATHLPMSRTRKRLKLLKKTLFKTFNGQRGVRECGNEKNLQAYAQRQSALCHAQDGKSTIYQNDWLMAIGLGNSHPLENGLLWHPTLGVLIFRAVQLRA